MYLGTVLFYIHLVCSLLIRLPLLALMRLRKKKTTPEAFYAYAHKIAGDWARAQLKWAGVRADVSGLENVPRDGAVLFISDHQSNFDIALFLAYIDRPIAFLAKTVIERIPIVRTIMRHMGCVFMDREDPKQQMKAILAGIDVLKSGQSMVVFPEGTRSKGGPVAEFKGGSFKLATKSGAAVVPVSIDGSAAILERNKGRIKRADVRFVVHPPIDVSGLSREEAADLHNRVRDIVCAGMPSMAEGGAGDAAAH